MKANGSAVKQGKIQLKNVTYKKNGTSVVIPLGDWIPIPESVMAEVDKGNWFALREWNLKQIADFNKKKEGTACQKQ